MSDAKQFTQAEVDAIVAERDRQVAELKEEHAGALEDARREGAADGLCRAWEWLDERADQLEKADENRGFFEVEIAILRWASKRVGAL